MGMAKEFREFVSRGSVVDLAVGVVIGAAFGKIVTALVDGVVMPVISVATGGVSVSDWKWVLTPARLDAAGKPLAEVALRYGQVLQSLVDFLLIALVLFLVLKAYNRMRAPAVEAPVPEDVTLLREIRDLLRVTPR